MSKKESTFLNMVITLFVVSLVSSAAVGSVYELTKEPIAQAKLAKKTKAIKEVIPEFNNNPIAGQYVVDTYGGQAIVYPAKMNNKFVGLAIEALTTQGFSGEIKLMVGFLPDGTIHDVTVLEHKETPGLGDKMDKSKSNFSQQFKGKNPKNFNLTVTKDGGDVDAITAATISSRGFCDAIKRAYNVYKEEMKK